MGHGNMLAVTVHEGNPADECLRDRDVEGIEARNQRSGASPAPSSSIAPPAYLRSVRSIKKMADYKPHSKKILKKDSLRRH